MGTVVLFFSHVGIKARALCKKAHALPLMYIPALMAATTILLVTTAARMPEYPLQPLT